MGEAKRRGTKDARIANAIANRLPSFHRRQRQHRARSMQGMGRFNLPLLWAAVIRGLRAAVPKPAV